MDANGVDLTTGRYSFPGVGIAVGDPAAGGLAYARHYRSGGGGGDAFVGVINKSGSLHTVSLGGGSETFTLSGGSYDSNQRRGSTLTYNSSLQEYTYTTRDGTRAVFKRSLATGNWAFTLQANEARIASVTAPSGEVLTYGYDTGVVCFHPLGSFPAECGLDGSYEERYHRLRTIHSSLGFQLNFDHASNSLPFFVVIGSPFDPTDYFRPLSVTAINLTVDCAACTPTVTWPKLTFAGSGGLWPTSVTDHLGRTTTYASSGSTHTVTTPEGRSISYTTIGVGGRVASVTRAGQTWSYAYFDGSPDSAHRTTTVTDPNGKTRTVITELATGLVSRDTNELGQFTDYQYDSHGRVTGIMPPEGNPSGGYVEYAYDSRGNVTEVKRIAKPDLSSQPPTQLDNIVTTATYPSTCSNPRTCNQPTSTTDARGYRTDYTYSSTHGGVLTITAPGATGAAPTGSAPRPQTRFAYAQFQSRYKTGASTWTNGAAVWRLTATSACAAGSAPSCLGTANETVTEVAYPGPGTANNVLPTSVTTRAGDSAVSAVSSTTTFTEYTETGDIKIVDGPLSGTVDRIRFYYDAARQLTAVVGPDPDGGGPLTRRAVRTTYNLDGQVTRVERGTATGQSGSAPPGFVALERHDTVYDSHGRVGQSLLRNASTSAVLARAQYSYDVVGRPLCAAVRMSPAATPPSSACALGAASDRIRRTSYDAAGRVTTVESAVGTALQQDTATTTYTDNGRPATLTDAMGRRTTYEYDGFDRLVKRRYPNASGNGSSTSDYEAYTYGIDPENKATFGRLIQTRNRGGQIFALGYDNLGRVTLRDAPGSEPDVTTAYDLLGRATSVSQPGHTLTTTYDALSRVTSSSSPLGAISYQYDAAGRRTRMDYPGPNNFYVTYEYDTVGQLTAIREQGGSVVIAGFTYDDLGRRTRLGRRHLADDMNTSYGYDAAGRLETLAHEFRAPAYDQTLTFDHNAAGQITARTRTNGVYDWEVPASETTSYAGNGKNRYTDVGGVTPTYDGAGNLTDDGAQTYGYDARNRLVSVSGGVSLDYDPAGRLSEIDQSGTTTRFLYDGADLIAEYDGSGNVIRRYVHGPGVDEPLIRYESDSTSTRRWLYADERGSIVAAADLSDNVFDVNAYDAYGQPGAGNGGRFQYTGQVWLAEAGVYHYKMRAYHPGLGRFLQTDPIGYAGGMNLYGYVHNDPVNFTDPWGLEEDCNEDSGGKKKPECETETIVVWGTRHPRASGLKLFFGGLGRLDTRQLAQLDDAAKSSCGLNNELSFTDVSGGQGLSTWEIKWQLSDPSPTGGWIVQEIITTGYAAQGNELVDLSRHGWEAWQILPGQQRTLNRISDDGFRAEIASPGGGFVSLHVGASARFYEGLTLPDTFVPGGMPGSLSLPSTTIDPRLDTSNATCAVSRSWSWSG